MQDPVARAGNEPHQRSTSLFGGKPSHPFVPLERQSASVQTSGRGRGRPPRIPLPDESMTGCSRHGRDAVRLAILLITVLLTIGGTMPAVSAERAPARGQPARDRYVTYVAEAALRFGIPTAWIRAVMRVESNGDRRAVSPKGALGLMQLMPKTWADMRARYGLGRDPFDPHDNILAGAAFLRELHDRYGSPGFLAAYNAGPATRIFAIDIVHFPPRRQPMSQLLSLLSMRRGRQGLSSSRPPLVHPGRRRRSFSATLTGRPPPRQLHSIDRRTTSRLSLLCTISRPSLRNQKACSSRSRKRDDRNECAASPKKRMPIYALPSRPCCGNLGCCRAMAARHRDPMRIRALAYFSADRRKGKSRRGRPAGNDRTRAR